MLYFDTDSILFSHRPGQPIPPLGDHLGEFTSELKAGDHIVEFAAAGPKNYGYKTKDGKVECKVRGFTLNAREQEQLNFDLLKQNVIDEVTEPYDDPREIRVHNPHKIKRDANTKTLQTIEETKRYKVVFHKRVVDPDTFQSYPYGHEKQVTVLDDDLSQAQAVQLDDVDINKALLGPLVGPLYSFNHGYPPYKFLMAGTSFSDRESLMTTAHVTCEICLRYLKYRKSKTNNYYIQGDFFLSVRDWIKTKVFLWASVVKRFSLR